MIVGNSQNIKLSADESRSMAVRVRQESQPRHIEFEKNTRYLICDVEKHNSFLLVSYIDSKKAGINTEFSECKSTCMKIP